MEQKSNLNEKNLNEVNVEDFIGEDKPQTEREKYLIQINGLSQSLIERLKDAVVKRQGSMADQMWQEDIEYYEGVDEHSRVLNSLYRTKPLYQDGIESGEKGGTKASHRSKVFPNITHTFVSAGAAHVADLLLPTGNKPWKIEPTPIPERDALAKQYKDLMNSNVEKTMLQRMSAKIKAIMGSPEKSIEMTMKDRQTVEGQQMSMEKANEELMIAREKAELASNRIWDWQVESDFIGECRKVIESAAKIGTGILKGPVPVLKERVKWENGRMKMVYSLQPGSMSVDPFDLYPDPSCGNNIHDGDYVFERTYLSRTQLRAMRVQDNAIIENIDKCLTEKPKRLVEADRKSYIQSSSQMSFRDDDDSSAYEAWLYWGHFEREDMEATGIDLSNFDKKDIAVPGFALICNERIIRLTLPSINYGGFPYDIFTWMKRENHWTGIGISRLTRTAQQILVASTRQMLDNAGLAGGPMVAVKTGMVRPSDNIMSIAPGKIWEVNEHYPDADTRTAISSVRIDPVIQEMLEIIQFSLRLAEETTGLPTLLQGQLGRTPDRVGVAQIVDRNANASLRRIGRMFSDQMMKPHLTRYYYWQQQHGPENERGDFTINVKGYTAIIESDIRSQFLQSMLHIVMDPRFGIDPAKWRDQFLKTHHFDPTELQFDDEQWQEIIQNWQQILQSQENAQDPKIQVASIQAQAGLQGQQMKLQAEQESMMSQQQFDALQAGLDREHDVILKSLDNDWKTALKHLDNQTIPIQIREQIKSDLAKAVMKHQSDLKENREKLNTQMKLASIKATNDRMTKPPTEPPGRAKPGQSWSS